MTDFAQQPLWEDEGKQPPIPKQPVRQPEDPLLALGNASRAKLLDESKVQSPVRPEVTQMPDVQPQPLQAEPDAPEPMPDWRAPFQDVMGHFTPAGLNETLPVLLQAAPQIPQASVAPLAGMIVSAFLALPLGLRKATRDVLNDQLSRHMDLALAQLILTRLGGLPAAAPAPPPPAPPATP